MSSDLDVSSDVIMLIIAGMFVLSVVFLAIKIKTYSKYKSKEPK